MKGKTSLMFRGFIAIVFLLSMSAMLAPAPVAVAVTDAPVPAVPVVASVLDEDCPGCVKVAPDLWVCEGRDDIFAVNYPAGPGDFIFNYVYWDCEAHTPDSVNFDRLTITAWDPDTAGSYTYLLEYSVNIGTSICTYQTLGMIHVVEACVPNAPDVTICVGEDVASAMPSESTLCPGVDCYVDELIISGVNNAVPGTYDYTVTCRNSLCDLSDDDDNTYLLDTCCEESLGGHVIVEECVISECYAPSVTVCEDTVLDDSYFTGAGCGEGGPDPEVNYTVEPYVVDTSDPGGSPYLYSVTCGEEVCEGLVTVLPACTATAPDFTICQYTPVRTSLFVENGAMCSEGCDMSINKWGVRSSDPGVYNYEVTCTDPCGGDCGQGSAVGTVTVEPYVKVEIIECPGLDDNGLPQLPEVIAPSTVFGIKAEIQNKSGELQYDVTPYIMIDGPAELHQSPDHWNLGNMEAWDKTTAAWTLHCTGPGTVTVTVWVNNQPSNPPDPMVDFDCTYDTCEFDQRMPAEIDLTCYSQCDVCTNCDPADNEFDIWGKVTNDGQTDLEGVVVELVIDGPAEIVTPAATTEQNLFTIDVGDDATAEWTVRCTGEGDVTFTFIATGDDECTGEPVETKECQTTTHQRDVLITDLYAERSPDCGDSTCDDGDVCYDECDEGDRCNEAEDNTITVSVGQAFTIFSEIKNCTGATVLGTTQVALKLPAGTAITGDVTATATGTPGWGPAPLEVDTDIMTGYAVVELVDNFCACCVVDMEWPLECTGATGEGSPSYEIVVILPDSRSYPSTLCLDGRCVVQESAIDLVPSLTGPYVEDCDSDSGCGWWDKGSPCWIPVDAVKVCQDYDVDVTVTNEGDADAYDVRAHVRVTGDTTCTNPDSFYDIWFGCIEGNSSKTISLAEWLDDNMSCTLHCEDEDMANVQVLYVEGRDENTCELLQEDNFDCGLDIPQCDITVEIINPESCTDIDQWELYAVKAKITNHGDCTLEDVTVRLMMEGDVQLAEGSVNPVTIATILPADPDCEEFCYKEYEVTWMVQCVGDGEVYFDICVEVGDPVMQFKSEPDEDEIGRIAKGHSVVVHQQPRDRAEVCIDILSPDSGAIYATSQEFAISARISNLERYAPITINEAWVSVDDVPSFLWWGDHNNIAIGDPIPPLPWTIGPKDDMVVTWTATCAGSGTSKIKAGIRGISDEYEPVYVTSEKEVVWQYPAAHLEVEITTFPAEPIVTSTTYPVTAIITNTGEADATEVYATLSVTPEGSVRVAGPSADGYTQYIGTLPGHGSEANSKPVTWSLHCKVACDSTLTITVSGNDEYGWHQKQECQTTGTFIIEGGCERLDGFDMTGFEITQKGWFKGFFYGDANGLIGPFSATSPVSWSSPDDDVSFTGTVVLWGEVIPDGYGFLSKLEAFMCCRDSDVFCNECEDIAGKDIMSFTGYITCDDWSEFEQLPDYTKFCVEDGMLQIINGQLTGSYGKCERSGDPWIKRLLGGEYCSTMAATASRAIEARFIEPDSVTVKQLPLRTDIAVEKSYVDVNGEDLVMGDLLKFTITVSNLGPSYATSIKVMDVLPAELNIDLYGLTQGWYDVTSGYWTVGDLASGSGAILEIWANVNTVGEVCNIVTVVALDQHDPVMTNNMAEVCFDVGSAPPVTGVTLDLDDGLNLISLPLIPDDLNDPYTALLGINAGAVSRYDKSTEAWVTYINGTPSAGYLWQDGLGYWVTMGIPADDLPVNGAELVSGLTLPPDYPVYGEGGGYTTGWNLIGFKSTTPKLPSAYLAGVEGKYVMIYGFDDGAFYAVGSPGHAMLQPGFGYWLAIKDGESGNIFP